MAYAVRSPQIGRMLEFGMTGMTGMTLSMLESISKEVVKSRTLVIFSAKSVYRVRTNPLTFLPYHHTQSLLVLYHSHYLPITIYIEGLQASAAQSTHLKDQRRETELNSLADLLFYGSLSFWEDVYNNKHRL